MGVAFLLTALRLGPSPAALIQGSLWPALPAGSGLLVLGLVGTTVVPYNLFLGSGVAAGQTLSELRFGLAVAVGLGGLISMGVLVVGTAVAGEFSFAALAAVLGERLGPWAVGLFAAGLAAAGLTSAVTAPLAAAITAAGLFGGGGETGAAGQADGRWSPRGWRFRAVWMAVLAVGLVFGLTGVKPIPVILLAQALNGVLLPWVAVFLLLVVNDRRLMGEAVNGWLSNLAMVAVVGVTWVLGMRNVVRAGAAVLGVEVSGEARLLAATGVIGVALGAVVLRAVRRGRA
jgi:Mn2+/Fe2+ NRAMP family transporter